MECFMVNSSSPTTMRPRRTRPWCRYRRVSCAKCPPRLSRCEILGALKSFNSIMKGSLTCTFSGLIATARHLNTLTPAYCTSAEEMTKDFKITEVGGGHLTRMIRVASVTSCQNWRFYDRFLKMQNCLNIEAPIWISDECCVRWVTEQF